MLLVKDLYSKISVNVFIGFNEDCVNVNIFRGFSKDDNEFLNFVFFLFNKDHSKFHIFFLAGFKMTVLKCQCSYLDKQDWAGQNTLKFLGVELGRVHLLLSPSIGLPLKSIQWLNQATRAGLLFLFQNDPKRQFFREVKKKNNQDL